jgi:hypothetical protein
MVHLMTELIDVRADAISPGEAVCLSGALILITAVDTRVRTVDLHTEYGPALRFLRHDVIAVAVDAWQTDAA